MYVQEKGIPVNEPVRNASDWSSNENPIGLAGADLASAVERDLGRNLSHTKTASFPSTLTFLLIMSTFHWEISRGISAQP